ncbi:MAG: hypothetical protein ABS46_14295 [Cytophagaceae bacterium SCN 52-12]|nr:MAG: hypothetical protein ABS46_14295 [Cytophagaceae bacterium SCN 52-12]
MTVPGRFLSLFSKRVITAALSLVIFIFPDVNAFQKRNPGTDSLPAVFNDKTDVLHALYRHRALNQSKKYQVPAGIKEWNGRRAELREHIIRHTGAKTFKDLPLDMRETGSFQGDGFTVRNIYFQTRPGVYATANLYVPDRKGQLPAVVVMMGHSRNGKLYENYQSVGQSLAKDGYVALCIDPWGAGERTTVHGEFEYHGAALGASLYNIGETLMGMQLTDNMRAIDLLSALPYVDKTKIGATGASGGGNQTMWLAAIDERVKAAMPVVSVGTFDSYIMAHNCICEVLPQGLTFTEEWGVLGLVAPRAIKMCNHNQESNRTFFPSEMLKSFVKAKPVFDLNGAGANIGYEFFERPHGYYPEDRRALLGWMDLHLKGTGDGKARDERPITLIPEEKLMVFPEGRRDALVHSTGSFCRMIGAELRQKHAKETIADISKKRSELQDILAAGLPAGHWEANRLGSEAGWDRVVIETAGGRLIPVLHRKGAGSEYTVLAHAEGKQAIPLETIARFKGGIIIVDFSGTGEAASDQSQGYDKIGRLHTYGRASLWLGETVIGNWVGELGVVADWARRQHKATRLSFHGFGEAGLAGVFYSALNGRLNEVHTYGTPASYVFDARDQVDHFGIGIHVPRILHWGDLSLAAGLSDAALFFHEPVSMSGRLLDSSEKAELQKEYDQVGIKTRAKSKSRLL